MAVPPIDFSSFPPEGSRRAGGTGLEAAANRYIERMRCEKIQTSQTGDASKKLQADGDTVCLARAAMRDTKATSIMSKSSEKPLVSQLERKEESGRQTSLWESMKGGIRSGCKVSKQ